MLRFTILKKYIWNVYRSATEIQIITEKKYTFLTEILRKKWLNHKVIFMGRSVPLATNITLSELI